MLTKATPQATSELAELLTPRLNGYIKNTPTVKQTAALLVPHLEVLFGGAAGGGKSDWLLMSALQYVDEPGYAAIIFRTTHAALSLPDGLIPRSHEWLAGTDARWNEQKKTWHFPSGASLTFGYLEGPRDKFRYASSAYQFIGFEELTEFRDEQDYRFLFSRCRRKAAMAHVPLRIRSTTNPIGPGFDWVKARFQLGKDKVENTEKRIYIPSTLDDNPFLDVEEYEKSLDELPPDVRERLRMGSWRAMSRGEFFGKDPFHLIEPHQVPKIIKSVRSWDLAGTAPTPTNPDPDYTAGVHIGMCEKGNVYIMHGEYKQVDVDAVETLVVNTAKVDGRFVYVLLEQEGGQAGKAQIKHFSRLLKGYDFHSVSPTGDKTVRAAPLAAQARHGNVYVVCSGPWVKAFLDETDNFPYAKHDHLVDAAAHGYNFLVDARPKRRERNYGPRVY
ncbi:MAG: phage terminase large subunit [Phycisphaerales bacterium JB052]